MIPAIKVLRESFDILRETMPSAIEDFCEHPSTTRRIPLQYSGSFNDYESIDLTNAIGREYPKVQLSDIVDDDTKIRDLAILCSQRGVVFFRNQNIKADDLKVLTSRLGELTGKPKDSKVRHHTMFLSEAANYLHSFIDTR